MTKRFHKAFIAIVLVLCMVLPVLTPVAYAAGEAGSGKLKDYHSMTMEEIFALDEDLTWVMTGDSITHNGSWTQGMNSYSEWMEQYLYMIGRGDDSVINSGWGGADIKDFLYEKDTPNGNGAKADPGMGLEQFITKYNPDVVTIKLGMNNRDMADANFIKYYNMMLDGIYAEGEKNGKIPKVIILTPTPMSGENLTNQDEADKDSCWRFQRILQKIASERDLLFVDLQTAFCTASTLMGGGEYRSTFYIDPSDGGIHPNAAGHYLIFKTLSKVLGIYDEDLPLYQMEYEDLIYHSLWSDSTGNLNLSAGKIPDSAEMNKTMPAVNTTANKLAYVEFDAANGLFSSTTYSAADKVDLTDANAVNDALTLDEVKSMGNEFTVVFRAKLGKSATANQPILFFSTDGFAGWDNALTLGIPGTSDNCYYEVRLGGTELTTNAVNNFTMTSSNASVGAWHTIAIVQSEDSFTYYIDGEVHYTSDAITLTRDLGDIYASATDLYAAIGIYSSNAGTYLLDGEFDFWALYDGALSENEISAMTVAVDSDDTGANWSAAYKETNLWAVAGAEQMSGYQGMYVNRSLFRLLDNTIRNTGSDRKTHRDIRLLNVAAPGYTVSDMAAQLANKEYDVLLLLPEVSLVYAENYVHSADLVAEYKSAVKALLAQNADKVRILWTPLASADGVINGYLDDYADAIRQIAAEDESQLFWDANAFMNENMQSNASLLTNWFDADMYITPLAALDVARGFFTHVQNNGGVATMRLGELNDHNLRQTSDIRKFKGTIVRDNIAAGISVTGTTISMDLSAMAGYDLSNVKFVAIPSVGYGDCNDVGYEITNVSVNGNVYSFEAPCSNPVIAIYAGNTRFRDMEVKVTTSASISKPAVMPTDLTGLKVVGAPDIGFSAGTTSYKVNLFQYQRFVQIIGTAADGQTITVNGEEVLSGERSPLIEVEDKATVTVKANGKTYTLDLVRPEYPDIIITEVLQASSGDLYDMIEIYNASGKELDLKDYSIGIKKDYTYSFANESGDKWPYYFEGNNTGFHSTSSNAATQTAINPITKYSTYNSDFVNLEPDSIPFPADSTMVIWVKVNSNAAQKNADHGDLVAYLESKMDGSNYSNKALYVPDEDQIVIAEVPVGSTSGGLSVTTTHQYGYMENHGAFDEGAGTRTWLFVLDKDAERAYRNGLTKDGDDIFSAALLSRVSTSADLSTVLYYDVDRGLSAVKDASILRAAPATGYTSDKSGYMNLTTFGAIEYWQKPYDLADTFKPEVKDNSKDGTISLSFKDDTDIRFMVICIDTDGDGEYDEVIKKDYVLESSAASATGTPEVKAERTYELKDLPKDVKYYGFVLDDNNNKTTFGNGDPMDDLLDSFGKDTEEDTNEGTSGGNTGSSGNTGSAGDNTNGGSTGSAGDDSTDATEGNTGDNTGSAGSVGGTAGGNTTGGSTSSSVSGNTGNNEGSPSTGTQVLQIILVTTIVLISAAIIAVMGIIGYKYKKLNG